MCLYFSELGFGIIGFMSQNTEGVSDLGNLQNFLNLLPIFCHKNAFFYSKIDLRHKTDNSVRFCANAQNLLR